MAGFDVRIRDRPPSAKWERVSPASRTELQTTRSTRTVVRRVGQRRRHSVSRLPGGSAGADRATAARSATWWDGRDGPGAGVGHPRRGYLSQTA
jgi:hypothetical protein